MNGACVVAAMTAAIPARAYPPASAGDPREAMTCGTTAPTRPPSAAPRNIEGVKTPPGLPDDTDAMVAAALATRRDRKSTRLNSSHLVISYAVFCLKKQIDLFRSPLHRELRSHFLVIVKLLAQHSV